MVNDSLHDPNCTFKYAGFTLAGVYMILLVAVVRFFVKLVISKDHKRQAQKVFLGLVTFQCAIRMFFFFLWPILGPTCYPVLSARTFDWLIIPGDFPAALFLTAFGVLVITFARIYHIVLHGDVRSMRRFRTLIAAIILVNTGVYLTQIADWINSATGDQYPIFADVYPYVLAGAAFCTALQFLVYGTLLFFHVRKVLRHTGNNNNPPNALTQSAPVPRLTARLPAQPVVAQQQQQAQNDGAPLSGSPTPQRVSIAVGRPPHTPSNPSHAGSPSSNQAPHRVLISSVAQAMQPSSPTHQPLTVGTIQAGRQSSNSSPSTSPPDSPRSSGSRNNATPRQPTRYSEHHHIVVHHPPPPELDDEGGSPQEISALSSPPVVVPHTSPHFTNHRTNSIVRPHVPSPQHEIAAGNAAAATPSATVTSGSRNPMRKVAQIAAICTMCLLARTILLPIMAKYFSDAQNPWITVIYFTTAELLPLIGMLVVFESATDQNPMAGAGRGRAQQAAVAAHTTDAQNDGAAYGMDDNNNGSLVDPNDAPHGGYHSLHGGAPVGSIVMGDDGGEDLHYHPHHHQQHHHHDDMEHSDRSSASRTRHHQPLVHPSHDDHQPLHEPLLPADT